MHGARASVSPPVQWLQGQGPPERWTPPCIAQGANTGTASCPLQPGSAPCPPARQPQGTTRGPGGEGRPGGPHPSGSRCFPGPVPGSLPPKPLSSRAAPPQQTAPFIARLLQHTFRASRLERCRGAGRCATGSKAPCPAPSPGSGHSTSMHQPCLSFPTHELPLPW